MKKYKPTGPNPSLPNVPIGRHERISYGVSERTSTQPTVTQARTSATGKSVSVRTRSRKK